MRLRGMLHLPTSHQSRDSAGPQIQHNAWLKMVDCYGW